VSLDALAPDQRAVVQLVLQQDRSYEDLAALLGITPAAVRERALRGLDRLAPGDDVDERDRAEIGDYLLGQQTVSARESTRGLLGRSEPARQWALVIAEELAGVARSPLPEVPAGDTARVVAPAREPEPEPFTPDAPVIADPLAEAAAATPSRARPRPRRGAEPAVADFGFGEVTEPEPAAATAEGDAGGRSSRLGGALLIAGLGIFVAALIVWLVTRGGDNGNKSNAKTPTTQTTQTTPSSSATPTGTPNYQEIGALKMTSATGGPATGKLAVFLDQASGKVAFNITATHVPQTAKGQAYGVWLTGGSKSHFLGFAPPVGRDGKLAVSGPRTSDQTSLPSWLGGAKKIVVSIETQEGGSQPGPLLLEGDIAKATSSGGTATATP
jgi:hypothetical protein